MNTTSTKNKVSTLLGSMLIGVMVFAALAMASPAKALADTVESEPNNSTSTADTVRMKEWVYGWNDKGGVGDYYKFTMPSAGTMTFWFASLQAYNTMNTHGVLVYDKNHCCVASANFYQNTTASDYIVPTWLPAGTYYVAVDDYVGLVDPPYYDHPYAFYVDYSYAGPKVSKATAGKKKFTVKWGKCSGATAYQVRYSTKSNMKGAKTVTVSSSASAKTIKAKAKKKYYVQVRVAKKANGKTYWSNWSGKKSVKTR